MYTGEKWEFIHRNCALKAAETYAGMFPDMDWVYIGQWPIEIKIPGDNSFGNAVPLSRRRTPVQTHRMFNIHDDSFEER